MRPWHMFCLYLMFCTLDISDRLVFLPEQRESLQIDGVRWENNPASTIQHPSETQYDQNNMRNNIIWNMKTLNVRFNQIKRIYRVFLKIVWAGLMFLILLVILSTNICSITLFFSRQQSQIKCIHTLHSSPAQHYFTFFYSIHPLLFPPHNTHYFRILLLRGREVVIGKLYNPSFAWHVADWNCWIYIFNRRFVSTAAANRIFENVDNNIENMKINFLFTDVNFIYQWIWQNQFGFYKNIF